MDAFWSLSLDISNIYHNFDDNIDEYLLPWLRFNKSVTCSKLQCCLSDSIQNIRQNSQHEWFDVIFKCSASTLMQNWQKFIINLNQKSYYMWNLSPWCHQKQLNTANNWRGAHVRDINILVCPWKNACDFTQSSLDKMNKI